MTDTEPLPNLPADDWKAIELFEREAVVLASLEHPGIPTHIDHFTRTVDGPPETALLLETDDDRHVFARGLPLDDREAILAAVDTATNT